MMGHYTGIIVSGVAITLCVLLGQGWYALHRYRHVQKKQPVQSDDASALPQL